MVIPITKALVAALRRANLGALWLSMRQNNLGLLQIHVREDLADAVVVEPVVDGHNLVDVELLSGSSSPAKCRIVAAGEVKMPPGSQVHNAAEVAAVHNQPLVPKPPAIAMEWRICLVPASQLHLISFCRIIFPAGTRAAEAARAVALRAPPGAISVVSAACLMVA